MTTTQPLIRNEIMIRPTDFKNLGELRAAKQLTRQQLIDQSKTVYNDFFFGTMPTLKSNVKAMVGGALIKSKLSGLKDEFDYEEYGGAPVLGVSGPVIKMHGSSTARAVKSAILRGMPYAEENVVDIIKQEMLDVAEYIEED